MVTRNADASHQQGDSSVSSAQGHPQPQPHPHPHPHPVSAEQLRSHAGNTVTGLSASSTDNTVFKSGPLLVSSKGIGWTSWKKRWFILTRTSLVFFRSDPSAASQKGSEVNLTLGGIDLNNSASVVVRAEKKLITVLFPDGRDGRAFTLKAETSEDLYEWKNALEVALAQAPGATSTLAVEQSGMFQNDTAEAIEVSFEQWRDKRPAKSSIIGRPVLFALEDADGSPSFLEKALQFIEQYGIKVEGILRQSADVDDVERRVQEYEQGKNEFSPDEDAHVIADCIKYVLRELPSSPVPASCCTSLLEAFRTGRGSRVNALHDGISKTFPEPNRQLLQRMLKMMRTVVYHKSENRMSTSAVAACMAPLLLRPLLAGDCEVENDFNMGGDGSLQLLRAAAAANHAQAIIITLLEEYRNIFSDVSVSPELYSESEGSGSEYEGSTDDETLEDDSYEGAENDIDGESEDDHECSLSGSSIDNSDDNGGDLDDKEVAEAVESESECSKIDKDLKADEKQTNDCDTPHYHQDGPGSSSLLNLSDNQSSASVIQHSESLGDASTPSRPSFESTSHSQSLCISKTRSRSNESVPGIKRKTVWGRTAAKKNLSMESIDFSSDDEMIIQSLETQKLDLQVKIATEENGNEILQASLERRKQDLYERCLALEQDVSRLLDQLQRERDLRAALESGLNIPVEQLTVLPNIDDKIREESEKTALAEAEVTNLEQKIAYLHVQIDQQRQDHGPACELCGQKLPICNQQVTWKTEQKGIRNTLAQESLPASKDALSGASHKSAPIQDSLYTSNKHPTKENPDSNNKDGENSSATTIVLPPDVRDDISNKAGPFPQPQSPKQQNTDSIVLTTNLSSDHLSIETQASPSSSENQRLDLTLQNGPLGGATTGSSPNRESVTQDPPSLAKQQSPKMQHLNSTGLTNNSSTSHQSVKTRASPSSSEDQAPQKQQPDTTLQNSTKYEDADASSSSSYQSVKTRALLTSSEYIAPPKQQPDTSLQNGTKYEGEATSSSSNHENIISTQEPESFPKKQSPKKQRPDSIGPTTNLSTSRLSVKTRMPSSSSENQTMHKQHPDLTIQNNKFEGATTSSASKFEVVTIQDLPPLSSKMPNPKQHLNQKQQPDSPYPNRSKFGGTAPSPVTEFEKALGQNPSYLSEKQLSSSQQTHSTSKDNKQLSNNQQTHSTIKDNKQLSNNQQTHSNSKNNKSKGTSAVFFGEESTKVGSSKKCSGKGEGTSGTNAMSRLTNLLNYMKERRSLDEPHNQDASRNHASEVPSLGHASETTNSR